VVWKKLNLTQQKHTFIDQKNYYYYYTRLAAFFQDNLGKPLGAYQKGKISLDLNEARDDGVLGRQWHQLNHMQTICTLFQTDNHTSTPSLKFFTGLMLFLTPNQQCQSTEDIHRSKEMYYNTK